LAFVGAINAPRRVQRRVEVVAYALSETQQIFAVRPYRRLTVPRSVSSSASWSRSSFVAGAACLCRDSEQGRRNHMRSAARGAASTLMHACAVLVLRWCASPQDRLARAQAGCRGDGWTAHLSFDCSSADPGTGSAVGVGECKSKSKSKSKAKAKAVAHTVVRCVSEPSGDRSDVPGAQ